MNAVPEPRTAAALAARRGKTDTALLRVHESITRLQREKAQVSVAAVARRANVSRTFLYANPEARAAIATAIAEAGDRRTRILVEQDDTREATWRERALNAEEALKAAQTEILTQRTRIGELLGQIRDLQAEQGSGVLAVCPDPIRQGGRAWNGRGQRRDRRSGGRPGGMKAAFRENAGALAKYGARFSPHDHPSHGSHTSG